MSTKKSLPHLLLNGKHSLEQLSQLFSEQELADATRSLTKQSFADECDMNRIVERAFAAGVDPRLLPGQAQPVYGEFHNVDDYSVMLNKVINANNAFAQLPVNIRNRFQNNPAQLIEFVSDSNNYDEAVKLGLVEPKKPQESPAPNPKLDPAPQA